MNTLNFTGFSRETFKHLVPDAETIFFDPSYTLKEQYEFVYTYFSRKAVEMRRENGVAAANTIIASPELSTMFEICTAGFYPACSEEDWQAIDENKTIFIGTISRRYHIYCSYVMEPNEFLLCSVQNDKVNWHEKSHAKLIRFSGLNI